MKNRIISVLLVAALMVLLASCGGAQPAAPQGNAAAPAAPAEPAAQGDQPAADGGGRTLLFGAGKMDPGAKERFEEYIMAPLKAAFPNDTINYEMFVDRQSMQVQVAAGGGPDILSLDGPTDGVEYFKGGRVISLDKYAEQYGWKDIFYEWAYESGFSSGSLISLPNSYECMLLYVNTKVFEENGWKIPETAAEMEAIMDECVEKGIMALSFGNSDYQGAVDWLYSTFMSCYPGPADLKAALEGKARIDEGTVLESMELMQNWWDKGYIADKKSQGISQDDLKAMFADNRAAMMINGSWAASELLGSYPECEWDAVRMPELRAGQGRIVPMATGGALCINAASKDQDFAAELLNQLFTNVDAHIKSVDEAFIQAFPIRAFDQEKLANTDKRVIGMYDMINDAQAEDKIGYCAWTFFPSDMRVYMNENTDNMFLGMLTPKAFMTEAQTFIDKAIADGTAPLVP